MPTWQQNWIRVSPEEWDGLIDEPAEYLKVYLGLRKAADFNTGIVGQPKRINEAFFRELLSVAAVRGRHMQGTTSRKTWRNILERLEKLGYAVRKKGVGELIFFLPKAPLGEVRPKHEGPMMGQVGGQEDHDEGILKNQPIREVVPHEGPMSGGTGARKNLMRGRPQEDNVKDNVKGHTHVAFATDVPPNPVERVFKHWQTAMGHPRSILDAKRKRAIAGRLKDGYSIETLCQAIDGCLASEWHMGKNDRHRRFDDIELICRDASKVDCFLALANKTDPTKDDLACWLAEDDEFIDGECHHV